MGLPDFLLIPLPIKSHRDTEEFPLCLCGSMMMNLWLFANICKDSSVDVEDMSVDSVGGF